MSMTDQKRRNRVEFLLLVAATGLFAAGLCFTTPPIFESYDYVLMWKPVWHFLTASVREGVVPLWNPYIDLGRPFLADMQNAVFYPPMYLICLGQPAGVFLLVWLHCLIAASGMRRLAESLQVGRWQGYFMVLCFLGSGALTARWMTGQIPYCWTLCYTPWLFWCAVRTNMPWNSRRVAVYALLLALQFLCGNPQVFWFSTVGQGVFILSRAMRLPAGEATRELCRGVCQFGVALAWCAALVAVVLLPFLELVGQGNRTTHTPAFANYCKLEWRNFGSLFNLGGLSVQNNNWETNLFVGAIVVGLGVAGLCRVREPNVRGLLGVLVAGLLIALGDNTPAFKLFYRWLPGFAGFRCHSRAGFLAAFVLICASGIWLSRPHPRLRAFWTSRFNFPLRYLAIGLVLLQTLDLLHATRQIQTAYSFVNITHLPPDYAFQPVLIEQLQAAGLMEKSQPPPRVCVPTVYVPANNAMMYRYSSFDAYFSLFLRRPWDYLHLMLGLTPPEFINSSLSQKVYTRGPFPYPDLALSAGVDTTNQTLCFATNPAPRAFLVYAAEVVPDYDKILQRLAGGHNIHQSALLEKPLPFQLRETNAQPGTTATIRSFQANSILLNVNAKENALLVLAEDWYPGWRAEVDGRVCDCVPANIWMRAVPVPAGEHQVRVYFHQNYLLPGALISTASACLLLILLLRPNIGVFRQAAGS
jgi:Bacterial membrane protein YfhO